MKPIFVAASLVTLSLLLVTTATKGEHGLLDDTIEKGTVVWGNDLDAAMEDSKKTGKPIFLLFQEIPG